MADIVGPSVLPLIVQLACSLVAALEDSLRTKVGVGHRPDLPAHSQHPWTRLLRRLWDFFSSRPGLTWI